MWAMDLYAELTQLLGEMQRLKVDYALCGGIALAVHGVPRATQDIDILVPEDALDDLRQSARAAGYAFETEPLDFPSGVTIVRFTKVLADGQPLMLDALIAKGPLHKVWKQRQTLSFDGGTVTVVSREGLISLKLAAGRPQDLVDVQKLAEVNRG
ncbi:MAG: nucleotidyl transferase AbiEii/AbiGii toxin family protein [Myxococcales bacterium]|nr:nucleotidyl transferase AbiEii/AbiGii toxin family protein [Myxococcales bacterium]